MNYTISMAYTKLYTPEELADIKDWAIRSKDSLPADLRLDTAVYIPDLPLTVGYMLEVIEDHAEHPAFYGEIELLFRIRKAIESAE